MLGLVTDTWFVGLSGIALAMCSWKFGEGFGLLYSVFIFTTYSTTVFSQTGPFGLSLGAEGLAGLDANILREIAAALNPSRQLEQQAESPQPFSSAWSESPSIQSQSSIFAGVSPSCTGKGGFFPDYSQKCRVYYRCSPSGRMARFECPMNYVFSEQLKRCDQPERVACTGKAYESLQPQNARAILPDPGTSFSESPGISSGATQARLSSGTSTLNQNTQSSAWPTITYNDQASGFYESLFSAVNERTESAFGKPSMKFKIMGDPQVTLDMDPNECYGRTNQYIPDPDTGCRGYVKCPPEFGKPFDSFICPTGMRFDLKTEQCLPRGQVRCMEVERLMPPGFGLDVFSRLNPTASPTAVEGSPGASRVTGYPQVYSPCAGKTGFVPDYTQQCKVYYYCNADGTSLNLTCPAEMVFNPALQSCDFFQSAPECKLPLPTPQKMRPPPADPASGSLGRPSESRLSTSPSSNHVVHQQQRALLPFLQVAGSPTKRPSPGVENQSKLLPPGLLVSLPENPNEPVKSGRGTLLEGTGIHIEPQRHVPDSRKLEGFGQPEPVMNAGSHDLPFEPMSNKINTGNQFIKVSPDQQVQVGFLPKRIGQSVPGSGVPTLYETECDGTVGYYIEPEAGCRIYHFCHANLTMETFSCPANQVFLVRSKSCVPSGAALCIDPISGDAKDILHKNWDVTTIAPVAAPTQLPIAQPTYVVTVPSSPLAAATDPFKCTPGTSGNMYGDVSAQCTQYFECQSDGNLITHHCPPNLKFNTHLRTCDWPEYIDGGCNEIKRGIM